MSFHRDTGLGGVEKALTFHNYQIILTDAFYLHSFWLTAYLAAIVAVIDLLIGFPTAYMLSRMERRWSNILLVTILATSLVTIAIKLLGLNVMLSSNGLINRALMSVGLIEKSIPMLYNQLGVLIGLVYYTLPIVIIILFGVVQTVPKYLEEATRVLGATRAATHIFVILPIVKLGLISAGLIAFNMSMGAFTSTVILGGGHVRTVPVLIQQMIIFDTNYALGSALSTVLLLFVFALNIVIGYFLASQRRQSR
jgi:putative spermidine/putrescine transport system permease protein